MLHLFSINYKCIVIFFSVGDGDLKNFNVVGHLKIFERPPPPTLLFLV